jgi:hypothetical protein
MEANYKKKLYLTQFQTYLILFSEKHVILDLGYLPSLQNK